MRKIYLFTAFLVLLSLAVTACQPQATEAPPAATPETVVKTVIVTQEGETIIETVVVTQEPEQMGPGPTITFWSTETQPARAEATRAIIERFTEQTGIGVKLVLTDEDSLPNLMTAAVAAGTLPDVVFHPIDFTLGWYQQGILEFHQQRRRLLNHSGKIHSPRAPWTWSL